MSNNLTVELGTSEKVSSSITEDLNSLDVYRKPEIVGYPEKQARKSKRAKKGSHAAQYDPSIDVGNFTRGISLFTQGRGEPLNKKMPRKGRKEGELEREARILAAEIGRPPGFTPEDWIMAAVRPLGVGREIWTGFVREEAAFRRELPRLLEVDAYQGKWVAFHDGREVDRDVDVDVLLTRFREEYGDVSVYVGRVAGVESEVVMDLGGYGTLTW